MGLRERREDKEKEEGAGRGGEKLDLPKMRSKEGGVATPGATGGRGEGSDR